MVRPASATNLFKGYPLFPINQRLARDKWPRNFSYLDFKTRERMCEWVGSIPLCIKICQTEILELNKIFIQWNFIWQFKKQTEWNHYKLIALKKLKSGNLCSRLSRIHRIWSFSSGQLFSRELRKWGCWWWSECL